MISDLGHFTLVLALCMALLQGIVPLIGAQTGNTSWMAIARPAAQIQFLLVAIAFGALTYAFLINDFSVLYVSQHSNTQMPDLYKIAAVWGSHEGSLLFWVFVLAIWTFAVTIFSRRLPLDYVARVLSIMGLVSVGFLSFMLFTSNPFEEVFPAPMQGRELNPMLQDPGLAFHPPMLYIGYVGFTVAFAFAIAALLGGRLDATWARWSRPWTTTAWIFLTFGIGLGSWWAYYELGWGGWWFWDSVENASFMPWLVGTALIHSLAVTEKRGTFKAWTVLLAIIAFSLSLVGTFLVRSGVLQSVHAFATDPERGTYILLFLCVVIGGSLALYAWRGGQIRSKIHFELLSRESFMLFNNVILVVTAAAVLLGTLYPLIGEAITGKKPSLGKPYFDLIFAILMAPLVVMIGMGALVRWKRHSQQELYRIIRVPLFVSIAAFVVFLVLFKVDTTGGLLLFALGMMLATWILSSHVALLIDKFKNKTFNMKNFLGLGSSFFGMWLAHIGIAIFIIGVTVVSTFYQNEKYLLKPGKSIELAGYTYTFKGVKDVPGPNYMATRGEILVLKDNKKVLDLFPEKRQYMTMPMTEASINSTLFRDLYITLGEPRGDGWIIEFRYRPFQSWIWWSVICMAVGGIFAASDKRYRRLNEKVTQQSDKQAQELIKELLGPEATQAGRA